MLRVERFEIGKGAKYSMDVRGNGEVIMSELVNLCASIHRELAPQLSVDSFMQLISIAIKENEPDEIKRTEVDNSSELMN